MSRPFSHGEADISPNCATLTIFNPIFMHFYQLTFSRNGGIIILESEGNSMTFEDILFYNFDNEERQVLLTFL